MLISLFVESWRIFRSLFCHLMASPSFRSDVWEHFRKVDKKAICCHCNKELVYCGGSTNLRDNLNRVHPSKYSPDSNTPTEKKTVPKIEWAPFVALQQELQTTRLSQLRKHWFAN